MAHIVVVSGSVATVQRPNAEFARRVQNVGHTVTLVSTPEFLEIAGAIGVDFVGTPAARRIDPLEPMPEQRWIERLRSIPARRRAVVDSLHEDEVARIVSDLEPDLVLVEIELAAHIMAMRARRLPLATLSIFPHAAADPSIPALHTTAIPGRGRTGSKPAVRMRWARFHAGLRVDLLRQFLRSPGDHRRSQFRRLAKRLGIARGELDFEQWVQPLVLTSIPHVTMTPRAFDLPRDDHVDRFDIGPMLLDSGATDDVPAPVAAVLDERRRGERRLIYASFGAFHAGDDSEFVRRLVTAVERRPEWDLVVGLGGRSDVGSFGETAANIHLVPWAPQRVILESADVAVIHGGYSSVHECIQARVPMLLHPFGIDQPGNAARIVYHGLGILGDRTTDTPQIIESHIERLIADSSFGSALDEMAAQTAPDDRRLASSIDALLIRTREPGDI